MTTNRLYIATILGKLKNLSQKIISKFISHPEVGLAMKKDSGAIRQPTPSPSTFQHDSPAIHQLGSWASHFTSQHFTFLR